MENTSFRIVKLHAIKKWQSARSEILTFLRKTFKVSIKTFSRRWEGASQMFLHF